MPIRNWRIQRPLVVELMDHIDQQLEGMKLEYVGGRAFAASLALFRCNRYLRAIDSAVEAGLGDTTGGNLRTLYEVWVHGHWLMLSSKEEADQIWGMSRWATERVLKARGEKAELPPSAPPAVRELTALQRAKVLGHKLAEIEPECARLPKYYYDLIFRGESAKSTHASMYALAPYGQSSDNEKPHVGLHGVNQGCEYRTWYGASITIYFAFKVFWKARLNVSELNRLNAALAS